MWTVLSGIFGGVLRLVPEFIKAWNRKQEMAHEKDMQKIAYDFQVLRGKQDVDMITERGAAEYNTSALDALKTAIEGQDKPLPLTGNKFLDFFNVFANVLSKLIRPVITLQWVVFLYPAVIIATFWISVERGGDVLAAMKASFGAEEKALVAFLIDFWFVGRVLDAGRKKYGGA